MGTSPIQMKRKSNFFFCVVFAILEIVLVVCQGNEAFETTTGFETTTIPNVDESEKACKSRSDCLEVQKSIENCPKDKKCIVLCNEGHCHKFQVAVGCRSSKECPKRQMCIKKKCAHLAEAAEKKRDQRMDRNKNKEKRHHVKNNSQIQKCLEKAQHLKLEIKERSLETSKERSLEISKEKII